MEVDKPDTAQRRHPSAYPFTAIVGQETLKLALLLNAVDPRVGGVLIRGEKGTAKSTAVRALANVLPAIDVVEGCRFGCDPATTGSWCDECRAQSVRDALPRTSRTVRVVDLPVSATEDRLVGTLDFETALKQGERAFYPGLLAEANRAILYVDEVNLLDDHLVDTLLDAAAMGVNIVEREGVSVTHPASFILVGTMNPEEGDIRPQLLDRFGLCVDVAAVREPEARVEIMRRRHAFEEDAEAFLGQWAEAESDLRDRLESARRRLPDVRVPEEVLYAIAALSIQAGVDGHRADTVMMRAATALAALEDLQVVTLREVERTAPLVLAHRLRSRPFEDVGANVEALRQALTSALGTDDQDSGPGTTVTPGTGQASIFEATEEQGAHDPVVTDLSLVTPMDSARRSISGRRQSSISADRRGRYVRSETVAPEHPADVALDATIRVAARRAGAAPRHEDSGMALTVAPDDQQRKLRARRVGATIVFCVDASGSMGAAERVEAARGAVLELLVDAYKRRDRVALVSFSGDSANLVLAPTASTEMANLKLQQIPTGGSTPLAAGVLRALEVIQQERRRDPAVVPWLVLVTDGRANVALGRGLGSEEAVAAARRVADGGVNAIVIDTSRTAGGPAQHLAEAASAQYVHLADGSGATVAGAIRMRI